MKANPGKGNVLVAFVLSLGLLSITPTSAAPPATVTASNGGTATFVSATGHYYQYVAGPVDFATAKSAAESARANGWAGYLATISSSQEYAAVRTLFTDSWWIGASDSASEGCWRWVNGTSSDLASPFFAQSSATSCSVPAGTYSGWGGGEPNDFNGNEDHALSGQGGIWNDFNATATDGNRPNGYLIEYGDRADFPNPPEVVTPVISAVFARVTGVDVTFSPVSGSTYQVKVKSGGNQVAASSTGLTNSPIKVEGLAANTDYSVELIATNSAGQSATATTNTKTYQSIRLDFQFTSVTLDGSNLSVAFAVNPDYSYGLIWDGTVQRANLKSSPQTISGWTAGKTIQLSIVDSYGNYGYSNPTLPTVAASASSNQATLTINPLSALTVGGTAALSTSGGSGTGSVTFASSTSAVCTVSGTTLTAVGAGTCSITATKAADSSYNSITSSTSVLVSARIVQKQEQTPLNAILVGLTPVEGSTSVYRLKVGESATLATTGGSGTGEVTWVNEIPSKCSLSGTTVTALATSGCLFNATKAGDANYNSYPASLSIVVSTATVSKIDPPAIAIVMKDLVVGESWQVNMVGDGLGSATKTYASLTPNVCTLSGLNVTAVAVGTCTISGTRLEDATYKSLTATKSVQVTAPLVDTSPPALNNFSISVTPTAMFENGTFSVSVPVTDATGVASVTATISRSTLSTNYSVGDSGLSSGTFNLSRTAGSALNGTWSASSSVNFGGGSSSGYLVSGLYDISVTATDSKGQSITVVRNSALIIGRQAGGPTLVNTALSATSVMRGNSVVVSTRAVAFNNTVSEVRVMISALGISTTIPKIDGNSFYGDYSGSINIPSSTAAGSYSVTISSNTSNGRTTGSINVGNIQVTAPAPTSVITLPTTGSTVNGSVAITAQASVAPGTTGRIAFVCATIDGTKLSSGISPSGYGNWWAYTGASYGPGSACFQTSSAIGGVGEFKWVLDASQWTDGVHSFEFFVVDSTGSQSSKVSRSFNVQKIAPTASFTYPSSGQTLSGPFTLTASGAVASGSTATIQRVCLTLDGSPVTSGASNSSNFWASYYDSGSSCWITTRAAGSMNFAWNLDATGWTNGNHTFTIKIIDSTGKQSEVVSRSATVAIALPTASFTYPSSGQTLSGPFTLTASGAVASGSTATIQRVCLTLDGSPVTSGASNSSNFWASYYDSGSSCWITTRAAGSMNFAWNLDASSFANGNHTLALKIRDSTNKESNITTLKILVNNPLPTLTITSPNSGAQVAGKVTIEIAMASSIGDVIVGISGGAAAPVNYASSTSSSAQGIPAETQLWSAGRNTTFKWVVDTTRFSVGQKTIFISVIDRANQVVSQSLTLDIQSTKPTIAVISPTNNQAVKGKVTFRAYFTSSAMDQRTIRYIGISEPNAKNLFSGSYGYSRLPNRYEDFSVPGGVTTFDASWTVDYSASSTGQKEIWFAIEDSAGDISESKVTFTLEKAKPIVQIQTPTSGQTISGQISLKVSASGDPATDGKIIKIALSNQKFTPQFAGSSTYCNVDSTYKCWSVQDNKNFEWTSEPGAFKDGPLSLTVIAFDESENQSSATVNVVISAVAPTVTITAPTKTIVSKDQFTLSARAIPNAGSGAEIIGVAISDRRAIPQFPGTVASAGTSGIPNTAAIWRVSNIKDLSWRIDPNDLGEGDNVINIFALDSNGKLGQTSIVIHVAPEATWELTTQGAAVLGQSVAVIVTMSTSTPFKLDPPIVATLQTGPTSGGPWSDTGNLTFDASGKATGRVLVTEKLYVRVNHPQLDSIQVGTSQALRIVNVPDPKRQSASTGAGAKNEDGSIPQVVCTASQTAKIKQKVSIVCSAQDVQDVSQPVQITAQTTSSPKKIGTAKIQGGKITGTFTSSTKGTFTVFLKGSGIGYVPWTSNPMKIKVK